MKTENQNLLLDYYQLYTFTKARVVVARRQAQGGNKNDARDVARYVRNSKIIEILRRVEFPENLAVDMAHLNWLVGQLEQECHPLNQPTIPTDDISKILQLLETLAQGQQFLILGAGIAPLVWPNHHGSSPCQRLNCGL